MTTVTDEFDLIIATDILIEYLSNIVVEKIAAIEAEEFIATIILITIQILCCGTMARIIDHESCEILLAKNVAKEFLCVVCSEINGSEALIVAHGGKFAHRFTIIENGCAKDGWTTSGVEEAEQNIARQIHGQIIW